MNMAAILAVQAHEMTRVLSALLLLLATACTPLYWVRPDTAPGQLEADLQYCQQQAWREAGWRSSFYHRPFAPYVVHDLQGRRILVWPHSSFYDPFGDRFFEEARLTQFCMRARGYELVPADKIQPTPEGGSAGKP
jgi:hypothetical protein